VERYIFLLKYALHVIGFRAKAAGLDSLIQVHGIYVKGPFLSAVCFLSVMTSIRDPKYQPRNIQRRVNLAPGERHSVVVNPRDACMAPIIIEPAENHVVDFSVWYV
jgi:hypothetical protein